VVVFMGDDIQLPPVLDSPVYHCTSNSPASIHGTLVWNEFDQCVILNTIVRQQGEDEKAFREVLISLRNYSTTSTQVQWLQQFQWQDLQVTHGEDLTMKMSQEALYIFPTRAEEWSHNKSKLIQMNQIYPVATLHAQFQTDRQTDRFSARRGHGELSFLFRPTFHPIPSNCCTTCSCTKSDGLRLWRLQENPDSTQTGMGLHAALMPRNNSRRWRIQQIHCHKPWYKGL
jgi:hypothetical protein